MSDIEFHFESSLQLIEAAKEYLPVIEVGIESFLAKDNRTGVVDKDPKTEEHLIKVRFKKLIAKQIPLRIYDLAGYLRSALDQACYASAVCIKGGEPKKTKFLFANTIEGLTAEIKRGTCKDLHPEIIRFMEIVRPYEAGNKALWSLNKLRNKNQHRILCVANATATGFGINGGEIKKAILTPCSEWRPLHQELVFVRASPESEFRAQIDPTIIVELDKSLGFSHESAAHTLNNLVSEVESIVMGIKAETARILNITN
ncbi:hypothetical protein [Asticcacaulis taihuensis]|uniref:hypothetical protein n=1 Tax=Asticcacaulis taihuensis TaxID=260084 RepID=UPI0026E94DC1|nr:hypothetical protein [Asticcacaulis taihuensis]